MKSSQSEFVLLATIATLPPERKAKVQQLIQSIKDSGEDGQLAAMAVVFEKWDEIS